MATSEPPAIMQRLQPSTMASFDGMTDFTTMIAEEDYENPLDKYEKIKKLRAEPPVAPSQQKDVLQRQENIVKYRETEFNLILNSKDRDWVNSTTENRYNFSVLLDSAVREQGTGAQATITNRFRNITKIEFIKIILPVEGLDVVVQRDISGVAIPTSSFVSTLSVPYISVIMDEMTGNNFGTSEQVDKSLAICQYDATWRSETNSTMKTLNRGYTLFFPKFMKAQRIYAPAPLASLQRMSFSIQNPENQLLSTSPDAISISKIRFGADAQISKQSIYSDVSSEYLFIETTTWFPVWSYATLDRIQIAGLEPANDITNWLELVSGHVVVGVGYMVTGSNSIIDGSNAVGYSNQIIIRNRFMNPDSGTVLRKPFINESALSITNGSVLNTNRQVQISLRLTIRELDSTTNLRPDNV